MNIGFDAKRLFLNFTGLGNYSRSIVKNLSKYEGKGLQLHLFSPKVSHQTRVQEFLDPQAFSIHHKQGQPGIFWRSFGIKKHLQQKNIDVYHGLSHEIPYGMKKSKIKSVVSMHDLIFLKYPSYYSWINRKIYRHKCSYALKHADTILAISESTKSDLCEFLDADPGKIRVLYQACHEQFYTQVSQPHIEATLKKYGLSRDYILYVGSIIERKNLLELVQAVKRLPPSVQLPLLVIGKGKSYQRKVREYISKHKLESLIVFCESAAFHDFPALYQGARALIYPSQYEGFGIPIIEALWSGTPVITSKTSSMPEAGGPHSLYIDPDEPEDIAEAIEKVLTDPQHAEAMAQSGRDYVQRFHGKALSQELREIYTETFNL